MNGYIGLGSKALKICSAVPKPKDGSVQPQQSATSIVQNAYDQYSQYYDQYYYWQQQQQYGYDGTQQPQQQQPQQPQIDPATYYSQQASAQIAAVTQAQTQQYVPHSYKYEHDDDYALVDYKNTIDIDKMNRETVDRDRNLYDSLESSKWQLEMLENY